jgi:glycerol-3-phosphate dehydrogenase (NAD(P)+)
MNLAIVGGGSWGTALAVALSPRFDSTRLWVHNKALAEEIARTRLNSAYLPEIFIPEAIQVTGEVGAAVEGSDVVLVVAPSQYVHEVARQFADYLSPNTVLVSAVKGIEANSLQRMSEVITDIVGQSRLAILSGPSFAREVAEGKPTAVVIAAQQAGLAENLQQLLSTRTLRIYTSSDVIGVELGGALKNVIALAGGVCAGLEAGHSALAALITRGLAEITRLAVAAGAQAQTLSGLAGMGDLVLTCTGALSRNRQVGIELAKGRTIDEIRASMQMVAEGVKTTRAALGLARRWGVEMPIAEQMQQLLDGVLSPQEAIRVLMERQLKEE